MRNHQPIEATTMSYVKTSFAFLRQTRRDFFHTGSVLPSSRALGRVLAAPLARDRKAARVLEVGPGTGAVTAMILRNLRPDDHLDIVEINDQFFKGLQIRFQEEEAFRRHREQVRL